jgi:hypothetical protein
MDRRLLALSAHAPGSLRGILLFGRTPRWNKSSGSWFRWKIGRISWIEHRAARTAKSEWSRLSSSPAARFSNA